MMFKLLSLGGSCALYVLAKQGVFGQHQVQLEPNQSAVIKNLPFYHRTDISTSSQVYREDGTEFHVGSSSIYSIRPQKLD